MDQYHYHPLPPLAELGVTPPFTLLLLLATGVAHDPLICSLRIVDAENAPPYEALFYSWGPQSAAYPNWCEGHPLPIRLNLDLVLRNLRLPTQARRLCVDAMCIARSSDHHLLGPKTNGLEDVFRLSQMVAEIRHASGRAYANAQSAEHGPVEQELDLITEVLDVNPHAAHLAEFIDREYVMRIWCVQEVVVSAS